MSALSRFMRDNSPHEAIRNRAEWRRWLALEGPIQSMHIDRVHARDFRLTPYNEDGTLDYGRQYVSWRGRGA